MHVPPPPPPETTHENDTLAVLPAASVTFAVTVEVAAVVGVPEIRPVEALTVSPAGRPVADHEYGVVPPVAASCSVSAVPVVLVCAPGLVTVGEPGSGVPVPHVSVVAATAMAVNAFSTARHYAEPWPYRSLADLIAPVRALEYLLDDVR